MIECTLSEAAQARCLTIRGELTIASVTDAKACLRATLVDLIPGSLALDLSKLTEVDAAGVQLLLCMTRSLHAAGMAMNVQACSDSLINTAWELDLADEQGCLGVPYQTLVEVPA
ncbi:MAG: STAS domain-containing protein [Aquabacterium sp.]|uniref:STAS domain-containing protein n=1 Tax=Aquabacterium sp. TaxID=1872578 RepID=UPI0025C3D5DB|nr:STAS domain-containing protein [Aquabacterium sp.]MBI5924081.1 STAS domain-containing protein [Aquabacterium sp.]